MTDHDHSIILDLPISNPPYGSEEEQKLFSELMGVLESVFTDHSVAEYDGYEFGDDRISLIVYGENADDMQSSIEHVITAAPWPKGSYLIKEYGSPASPGTRIERQELG